MLRRVVNLWRGLSTNIPGTAGVVLATSGFVLFLLAEVLRLTGIVTNAYVGLITYMALPALFVLGLLLIPFGWWLYRRRTGRTTRELLDERFDPDLLAVRPTGRRLFVVIGVLTLVNVVFLAGAGARMLAFMDTPVFCGTACHSVMHPEWIAYQESPHARVRCVDCHVGTGPEAAIDAKLNGLWQMVSATFDLYARPIPTPVHNLRPARETCERCHWPEAFYGDRIKRFVKHDFDEASTPRYTTLALKIGSGRGERRGEIHWHVAGRNAVRYQSTDWRRMAIRWVEVRREDGTWHRYENRRWDPARDAGAEPPEMRTLDCVDCHNRATHIYEYPEKAVDARMARGLISRELPFAKRQALAALTGAYLPNEDARESIARDFEEFYAWEHPDAVVRHADRIDAATDALTAAYDRSIHPRMNVFWGAYPDHLGHERGPGCRRCHSPDLVDADGKAVPNDCTLCHSILAYDSRDPFRFLEAPDPDDPDFAMHRYLHREFTGVDPWKERPDGDPPIPPDAPPAGR